MLHVLYITNDGLTDPLGRSQILPYLFHLKKDYDITIISCEKDHNYSRYGAELKGDLAARGIRWITVPFRNRPPILSALVYMRAIVREAVQLFYSHRFEFVHCRSHPMALLGYKIGRKLNVPFLFDMRSFYPDERVDGGLWPQSSLIYRMIYRFFKNRERALMSAAAHIVVLTESAKQEILSWKLPKVIDEHITVIPCCADLEHFDYQLIRPSEIASLKKELKLDSADLVVTYLGSIGTWYMLREMLEFFAHIKKKYAKAKFFFISCDDTAELMKIGREQGLSEQDIVVRCVPREKVPAYAMVSDLSLFFIVPKFSKKGSSPTKHGELMGLGIPVIANSGVGDTDKIIRRTHSGFVIESMDLNGYQMAIQQIPVLLKIGRERIRDSAFENFNLSVGVKKYQTIYRRLCSKE